MTGVLALWVWISGFAHVVRTFDGKNQRTFSNAQLPGGRFGQMPHNVAEPNWVDEGRKVEKTRRA